MGKRTLTGAMHPHAHPAPSWHLEVLSNATSWQWRAPTTPEHRRIKAQQVSVTNIGRKLIKWLEQSDADKPFIHPPTDASEHPSIAKMVEDLQLEISSLAATDAETKRAAFQSFSATIREGILIGAVSTKEMLLALNTFDADAERVIGSRKLAQELSAMLRSSVVDGLEAAQKMNTPGPVLDEMWLAMFKFVATVKHRFHDVKSLKRLLIGMPDSAKLNIDEHSLTRVIRKMVEWQSERNNLATFWSWCNYKIGTALSHLTYSQNMRLNKSMQSFLSEERQSADHSMRMNFTWLHIQSYNTTISPELFDRMQYARTDDLPLNRCSSRAWQLAIARMHSTGILATDAYRELADWNADDSMAQRWEALVRALLATEQPNDAVKSLCQLLYSMRDTWHLVNGLIASHATAPCGEMLSSVAKASNMPCVAMPLHIAAGDTEACKQLLGGSSSDLDLEQFETFRQSRQAESFTWRALKAEGGTVESKMELIDLLCQQFDRSTALSRSEKMRRAERAIAYQKALTGKASPTAMQYLLHAVTLDLDIGLWGRNRQIRVAFELVRKQLGSEAMVEMMKQLDGWREVIKTATAQPVAHRPCTSTERRKDVESAMRMSDISDKKYDGMADSRRTKSLAKAANRFSKSTAKSKPAESFDGIRATMEINRRN